MLRITASQEPGASHCFRVEAEHWTLDPATFEGACLSRRLELDRWLQEQGAVVFKVTDLAQALAAREHGGQAVELTGSPTLRSKRFGWPMAAQFAETAAHLARKALGLAEGS